MKEQEYQWWKHFWEKMGLITLIAGLNGSVIWNVIGSHWINGLGTGFLFIFGVFIYGFPEIAIQIFNKKK